MGLRYQTLVADYWTVDVCPHGRNRRRIRTNRDAYRRHFERTYGYSPPSGGQVCACCGASIAYTLNRCARCEREPAAEPGPEGASMSQPKQPAADEPKDGPPSRDAGKVAGDILVALGGNHTAATVPNDTTPYRTEDGGWSTKALDAYLSDQT